jgi:hypothetical protein
VIPVTDEIHLDIAHHGQESYLQPRVLRLDPWLGPNVQDHPLLLHDTRHWFEFTQASAGSQFYRPDNTLARARRMEESARKLWSDLHNSKEKHAARMLKYFKAVDAAGNAVAGLGGLPLTRRRFLAEFPVRARSLGQISLYTGLLALLGGLQVEEGTIEAMLESWETAYDAASPNVEKAPDLHPVRKVYHLGAFHSHFSSNTPQAALLPLLHTWTKAILLAGRADLTRKWNESLVPLHLDQDHFQERLLSLDAYLDGVEEALDQWGLEHGA